MGLTFEQLKPSLFKWAWYFRNNEFEPWDLISGVWLLGRIQKVKHIKLASIAVKRGMIDYMRAVTKSRERKRYFEKTGRCRAIYNFTSLDLESEGRRDEGFGKNIELADISYRKTDRKDFFDWVTKSLNRREKLIIKAGYQDELTDVEIAKAIGITASRVSQIHTNVLQRLKAIIGKDV